VFVLGFEIELVGLHKGRFLVQNFEGGCGGDMYHLAS
jgi:hypothetical protein